MKNKKEMKPIEEGEGTTPPVFNFTPVKKSELDLFAPAPEVKKMTRKDKARLREELLRGKSENLAQKVSEDGLFTSVFSKDETEKEIAAMEKTKKSKHQTLRHAIHKNEEEDSRTVFVGNISNTSTRKEIKSIFTDCGAIESVRIRCQQLNDSSDSSRNVGRAVRVLRGDVKKDTKSTATAYVLFLEKGSVEKALEKNSLVVNGHHIVVTRLNDEESSYPPETSIFIGNVAYDTTEEDIWSFFALHGLHDVKRVRLIRDRETGNCKGFGYVEFLNSSTVKQAISTRGDKLNGRELRIVHVNKSKAVKNAPKRRELRKSEDSHTKRNNRKRSREEDDDNSRKKRQVETEKLPWMGMTTNPRRKIPRDLRALVDRKRERPAERRAPVKRKVRNPEK